jgi:hypothetical protein
LCHMLPLLLDQLRDTLLAQHRHRKLQEKAIDMGESPPCACYSHAVAHPVTHANSTPAGRRTANCTSLYEPWWPARACFFVPCFQPIRHATSCFAWHSLLCRLTLDGAGCTASLFHNRLCQQSLTLAPPPSIAA